MIPMLVNSSLHLNACLHPNLTGHCISTSIFKLFSIDKLCCCKAPRFGLLHCFGLGSVTGDPSDAEKLAWIKIKQGNAL